MEYGDVIRYMMKIKDVSLPELVEKSNVPLGTTNKIIYKKSKDPSISNVKKLVNSLGYTLDDLERLVDGNSEEIEKFEDSNEIKLIARRIESLDDVEARRKLIKAINSTADILLDEEEGDEI